MRNMLVLVGVCLSLVGGWLSMSESAYGQSTESRAFTFGAPYTVVDGQSQLHTAQLFGVSAAELLDQLDTEARRLKGQVVKLHIVAVDEAVISGVAELVSKRYTESVRPAVTCVAGTLANAGAKLGVDAVIAFDASSSGKQVEDAALGRVLHAGPRLYVSGQAEKGASPEEATAKTLESLHKTLQAFESSLDQVVQVKGFLTDMQSSEAVRSVFKKFIGERPVPLVLVHWESSLPIEIELIAATGKAGTESIEYLTPPGMTTPTVYCRVARMSSAKTIYIGGLYATGEAKPMPADAEVNNIFGTLKSILASSGSDLEHLVKATYYVSSEGTSTQLNVLRPNYYNPKRPPAASKAVVPSVGRPSRHLTIDMVASPK